MGLVFFGLNQTANRSRLGRGLQRQGNIPNLNTVFFRQIDDDPEPGVVGPLPDFAVDVVLEQDYAAKLQVTICLYIVQVDVPVARLVVLPWDDRMDGKCAIRACSDRAAQFSRGLVSGVARQVFPIRIGVIEINFRIGDWSLGLAVDHHAVQCGRVPTLNICGVSSVCCWSAVELVGADCAFELQAVSTVSSNAVESMKLIILSI